ncbi:FUSC family protein [cf. Phormidesmis sp. LEGE 11477]|uniref:FUSC family protein n=1 Tax=cf. Phormidesmis sp. LEGE 11477 TaxID=1828680 RepID=UPI00187FF1A9|nr:FUSC family protein [cf. Phormidesmis sp. LEGE 11477]
MHSPKRRSFSWLQPFQIKPSKPAYAYGIRMLVILGGPVAAGFLLHNPGASVLATMAALSVGLIATSGTYLRQIKTMGAATIAVTLALLLANLIGDRTVLTLVVTFFLSFLLSFASLWGAAVTGVCLTGLLMFVISLAKFSSFADPAVLLEQCLLCVAGGLWAISVAAIFWIVRPYAPAAAAVAESNSALSQLAKSLSSDIYQTNRQTNRQINKASIQQNAEQQQSMQWVHSQDRVLQTLSAARNIWTSAWTTENASSSRGNRLLVSIEEASAIDRLLNALARLLITTASGRLLANIKPEIKGVIEQVAIALEDLSIALKQKQPARQPVSLFALEQSTQRLESQWKSLIHHIRRKTIEIQAADYTELAHLRKMVLTLNDLSDRVVIATQHITQNAANHPTQTPGPSIDQTDQSIATLVATRPEQTAWRETLSNNLTFRSVTFRHALRLAILITLSQLLSVLLPIPRGYWITLTVLFALKPNYGGTAQTIGQRVLGTVIGGVVGIILVMVIHSPLALILLLLLSLFAAIALRPLSYSLFIMMLTLGIVVLFEAAGIGSWEVGVHRIVDTLIGGAIAFAGIYLLFPNWEQQRLPAQLESTLQANLAYFQITISQYLHQCQPSAESDAKRIDPTFTSSLHRLRHQAALQNSNAEAAAQRLFSEPRHLQGEIEPVMALLFYTRSLFSSTAMLAEHLKENIDSEAFCYIEPLADALEQALLTVARALGQKLPLQPLPPLDDYLDDVCDRIQKLHRDRLQELTADLPKTTPTLQQIKSQTPVATELSQIVRATEGIHSVAARLGKTL